MRHKNRVKPKLRPSRRTTDRKAQIWTAFRALRTATAREVADEAGVLAETTRRYLSVLVAAGIARTEGGVYVLVQDTGIDPPVTWKGRPESESGQDRLWRALRLLRDADITELAGAADLTVNHADRYLRALHRAGYLMRAVDEHGRARFRMVRMTGPLAPVCQHVIRVLDRNTGETFWADGGGAP